jgi:hypothetical protein
MGRVILPETTDGIPSGYVASYAERAMRHLFLSALILSCVACADAPLPAGPRNFVAGQAVLTGSLAEAQEGFLMATLYPAGQRMPILSYKVALDDPSVTTQGDRRVFHFRLDSNSSMMEGEVPEGIPLEVGVRFDHDGYVDQGEGDVSVRVKAEPGDDNLELTLSPDS